MIDANPPKFTWGQTVRVKSNTYLPDRGGELGEVCDVVTVQTSEHAQSVFGGSIGEIAYLVEFATDCLSKWWGTCLSQAK